MLAKKITNELERVLLTTGKKIRKEEKVSSETLRAYAQLANAWARASGQKKPTAFDEPDYERGDPEAYDKMERRLIEAEKNFE